MTDKEKKELYIRLVGGRIKWLQEDIDMAISNVRRFKSEVATLGAVADEGNHTMQELTVQLADMRMIERNMAYIITCLQAKLRLVDDAISRMEECNDTPEA